MYKNSDIKFITIYYNSKIISKKKKNEKTIEIKKKKTIEPLFNFNNSRKKKNFHANMEK